MSINRDHQLFMINKLVVQKHVDQSARSLQKVAEKETNLPYFHPSGS